MWGSSVGGRSAGGARGGAGGFVQAGPALKAGAPPTSPRCIIFPGCRPDESAPATFIVLQWACSNLMLAGLRHWDGSELVETVLLTRWPVDTGQQCICPGHLLISPCPPPHDTKKARRTSQAKHLLTLLSTFLAGALLCSAWAPLPLWMK